jgi:S-adenosylmethionine:tRNA ribosyltransferase-isomerase
LPIIFAAVNNDPHNIPISAYDYDLPPGRIAQFPLDQRDSSKLLIHKDGKSKADLFYNLAEHLPANSTLVFNETKVIHARLLFNKAEGSRIEIFCLEPAGNQRDYQLAFQATGTADWNCLVGNSKRWKQGPLSLFYSDEDHRINLEAERISKSDSHSLVRFSWQPEELTFAEILEKVGKIPLPPYISRQATPVDEDHYQTVYATKEGSVAAPTAGLHFTPGLLKSLENQGMQQIRFNLNVGAGTFRPVSSDTIGNHEMHQEQIWFDLPSLESLYQSLNDPIVLVGTTSVRMMESLYWHGVKLILNGPAEEYVDLRQWEPYEIGDAHGIDRKTSLEAVLEQLRKSGKDSLQGSTRLIIVPGYRFRYPDYLVTNFHQPKSTLLLLIAAFMGNDWKKAYRFALDNDFRFLSYGDSCLFTRTDPSLTSSPI